MIARRQLVELGLTRHSIRGLLARGHIHPLHRGVYAVGHRLLSMDGRFMAVVLASGDGAVLSHRSAAALWSIGRWRNGTPEVTVPAARAQRDRVRLHFARLPEDERTEHDRVPVTTVNRTLLDLAAVVDRHTLARTAERAEALRLGSPTSLETLLARYPTRPGAPALRALVAAGIAEQHTRSALEDAFLSFVDDSGLPRPAVNTIILGYQVDAAWPARRLAVELDSRTWHDTPTAFETDRERDRVLEAAGWRVIRITWRQLHEDAEAVRRDLEKLLGAKHVPAA